MRKKVLYILPATNDELKKYTYAYNWLKQRGWENHLLIGQTSDEIMRTRDWPCDRYISVNCENELKEILEENQYDVIHWIKSEMDYIMYAVCRRMKRMKSCIVREIGNDNMGKNKWDSFERSIARYVDVMIVSDKQTYAKAKYYKLRARGNVLYVPEWAEKGTVEVGIENLYFQPYLQEEKNKRVLFVRSNAINPDSRVEKEMTALVNNGFFVGGVGWNRNLDEDICVVKKIGKGYVVVDEINIKAEFGKGFKRNLIPLLRFQVALFVQLVIKRKQYDIIHACDFDTALTSWMFCKMFHKTLIYDIFDFYVDAFGVPGKLKEFIKKVDLSIMNRAYAVIICTEERKEQIAGAEPKRLLVVQNSPDAHENFSEQQMQNEVVTIGYFGILNNGRLINELVDIVCRRPDLRLLIGGFGQYETDIKEKAQKYNNMQFLGKISYDKVIEYEAQCDILTALYDPDIPNHYYAAPNKFYEALMLGKPLVMCRNTGMSSIVEKEDIGILLDAFNEQELEKGIDKLIERKAQWEYMGRRGKRIYDNYYSWKVSEQKLIQLYMDMT